MHPTLEQEVTALIWMSGVKVIPGTKVLKKYLAVEGTTPRLTPEAGSTVSSLFRGDHGKLIMKKFQTHMVGRK